MLTCMENEPCCGWLQLNCLADICRRLWSKQWWLVDASYSGCE